MSIALYFDVHIPKAIADGLRLRSVDVLTAQEDRLTRASDSELLSRATEIGRVLFTHDEDFLTETSNRWQSRVHFAGVIYARPLEIAIGECVRDLELLAKAGEPADFADRVVFLPL
ncbi:MAG: DUF5615 family PIN-like protein [Candidatus Sumerlaeota bacterium]|nr:DUF5615 family PIN-like protein [Candidatus Sumerlaeota bacterium]